jgi:glutamine amidotransferase
MLSYFPAGIMPNETHITNGAELNPDGHGFAIVTGSRGNQRLMIHKGMDSAEVIARFMETRAKHMDGPALFHSRIATSGLTDVTGCHPFKVGSDNRTVVAHNGILFNPAPTSLKSDTRIFAETMLPRFGSLDRPRKFAQLEKFAGPGNKLVILTVNPARRRNAYIVNAEAGHWEQGQWHSNWDFEGSWWEQYGKAKYGKGKTIHYSSKGTDTRDLEPWPCDVCGCRDSVNTYTLICEACGCCNDCHMIAGDCMCYYGKQAYSAQPESYVHTYPDAPARVAITAGGTSS